MSDTSHTSREEKTRAFKRGKARLAAMMARNDLSDRAKVVGYALWSFADNDSGLLWAPEGHLIAASGKKRTAFYRGLAELDAKGVVEQVEKAVKNKRTTTRRLRNPDEHLGPTSGTQSKGGSRPTSGTQSGDIGSQYRDALGPTSGTDCVPEVGHITLSNSHKNSQQKQSAAAAEVEEEQESQTPEATPEPLEDEPEGEQVDAATVYGAYPRKVARQKALATIDAAAKRLAKEGRDKPHQYLLEKTRAYAAAVQPHLDRDPDAKRFIPHPPTWYGQGRYDDDPAEWPVTLERNLHGNRPREVASSHEGGADSGTRPRGEDPMPKARAILEREGIGEPTQSQRLADLHRDAIAAGIKDDDLDGLLHETIRSLFCNIRAGAPVGVRVIELKQNGAKKLVDIAANRRRRRQWEREKREAEQRRQQEEEAAAKQAVIDARAFIECETAASLASPDYDRRRRRLKARTAAGSIPSSESLARQHLETADERFGRLKLDLAPQHIDALAVAGWGQQLEANVARARAKRVSRLEERERRKEEAESAARQAEHDRQLAKFRDSFDDEGATELYRRFAERWPLPAKTMTPASDSFWEAAHDAVRDNKLDASGIQRGEGSGDASTTAMDVADPDTEQLEPGPTTPPEPAAPSSTAAAASPTWDRDAQRDRRHLEHLQAAKATRDTGATGLAETFHSALLRSR